MVEPLAAYTRLVDRADRAVHSIGDLQESISSAHRRADEALMLAAGVEVEATAPRELVAERDSMPVTVSIYNRGETTVLASEPAFERSTPGGVALSLTASRRLVSDSTARSTITFHAPPSVTMAWWLEQPLRGDTFRQPLGPMITGEDRLPEIGPDLLLSIGGQSVHVHAAPIVYRYANPARGEIRRPVGIVPELDVLLDHEVEYARANQPFERTMRVSVHSAATAPRDVSVSLALPRGLSADSAVRTIALPPFGDANVSFRVRGRLAPGRDSIRAIATVHEQPYSRGFVPIEYDHIRPLRYYRDAVTRIEAVNATFANLKIGYVRGVGDNVLPMLEELGLPVTELEPRTLAQTNLSQFSTIVLGTRAYESPSAAALIAETPRLMKFVSDGGTVVAQYGQFEMTQPGILPFPITLVRPADRVTEETAVVRVLDPGSPLLAAPNKISETDFANWVQERALYMPRTFDKNYRAVLSMNDKSEPPNDAAVLVAPVGRGAYVYTTLSFFRQLPAGNPGAARLFINLLSADQRAANRPPTPASGAVRP
jgi:hypothetical protein